MPSQVNLQASDFAHFRATNDPPRSHDRPSIRNIIGGLDQDISHLDLAISNLEDELSKLKAERDRRVEQRSTYANLVSPLRSLPLEIFGEIFLYAAADHLSSRLKVSNVCQLWRNAALSTSKLWSTIDGDFPKSQKSLREHVQACVYRARSRPLTLVHGYQYLDYEALPLILEATQSCPWEVFVWYGVDITDFRTLQDFLASTSRDTLESLTIEASDEPPDEAYSLSKPALDVTSFSKRLSKLSFSGWVTFKLVTLNAPWSQFTHLSIACEKTDIETIFAILRRCSAIEVFKFKSYRNHCVSSSIVPIHLPKLHTLHLSSELLFLDMVAALVITPLLQELIFNVDSERGVHRRPCQYLLANAKTLRRLWINDVSQTEIQDIIPQLDFLEELTLVCNDDINEQSFDNLQATRDPLLSNRNIPLPHLLALKIICNVDYGIQKSFTSLVESRCWESTQIRPVARLRRVSLQTSQWEGRMYIADKVEKWKGLGLDVNVMAPDDDEYAPGFMLSP